MAINTFPMEARSQINQPFQMQSIAPNRAVRALPPTSRAPTTTQTQFDPQAPVSALSTMQTPSAVNQQIAAAQAPISVQPPNINNIVPQQVQNQVAANGTPTAQQAQQAPTQAFGLSGGEQALQASLAGGLSAIETGTGGALDTLRLGSDVVGQQFQQGLGGLFNQNQLAQQQLIDAQNQALQQSGQIQQQGLNAIQSGIQGAVSGLSPFASTGRQANQQQAALSGALGQEAQQAAFDAFLASPEQAHLREQGELSIINQSAATGGLGGANVKKALARFGTGLAAQNFGESFNRLGAVSGQGLQAAGQASSLLGQGALAGGNLISNLGGQRTNLISQFGQTGAGLTSDIGRTQLGARQQLGGLQANLASQGAGFQQQAGQQASNLFNTTGTNIASARIGAGQNIAQNIQGTSQGLANLQNIQGASISDIIGSGAANISDLLSNFGQLDANQQTQLAQLLQSLQTGEATNLANLQTQIGGAEAGGIIGSAAGLRSGLGQLAGGISGGLGAQQAGGGFSQILQGTLGGAFPNT